jgi:hypothetical protein
VYPFFSSDGVVINFNIEYLRFVAAMALGFHIIILGNLVYVFFVERKRKNGKAETKYYLAAYLARFCFMTFTLATIIISTFQNGMSSLSAKYRN